MILRIMEMGGSRRSARQQSALECAHIHRVGGALNVLKPVRAFKERRLALALTMDAQTSTQS